MMMNGQNVHMATEMFSYLVTWWFSALSPPPLAWPPLSQHTAPPPPLQDSCQVEQWGGCWVAHKHIKQTGNGFLHGLTVWTWRTPLNSLPYVFHPGIPLVSGASVNFVHLRSHRRGGDQEHSSLLVGYFSDNELLQRDYRRLLVLGKSRWNPWRWVKGWREKDRESLASCLWLQSPLKFGGLPRQQR